MKLKIYRSSLVRKCWLKGETFTWFSLSSHVLSASTSTNVVDDGEAAVAGSSFLLSEMEYLWTCHSVRLELISDLWAITNVQIKHKTQNTYLTPNRAEYKKKKWISIQIKLHFYWKSWHEIVYNWIKSNNLQQNNERSKSIISF